MRTKMQVNFTGIKDPKIFLKRKGILSPYSTSDMKVHTIRMDCFLTDRTGNKELSVLKRITTNIPNLHEKYKNFTENDIFRLDISRSTAVQDFGYNIKFNNEDIQQWDNSIFGICTFICSITRTLLNKNTLESADMQKYIKAINIVADKIGKDCLNFVI